MLVDSNLQGPVRVTLTWLLIYNVPMTNIKNITLAVHKENTSECHTLASAAPCHASSAPAPPSA